MADTETKADTAPEAVAVSAKARLAATEKLSGENYPTWNVALRQILQSEGLSFVFDDKLQPPEDEAKIARASLIMNQTVAVKAHNRRIQQENLTDGPRRTSLTSSRRGNITRKYFLISLRQHSLRIESFLTRLYFACSKRIANARV